MRPGFVMRRSENEFLGIAMNMRKRKMLRVNVAPRIVTLKCFRCGKEFSYGVMTCEGLPGTKTIMSLANFANGFELEMFCSRECAEEFMSREENK